MNTSPLNIAVLSLTDHPMKDAGSRTVALVDRVRRSRHRFDGLKQILPDGESIHGTWQRWLNDPAGIDVILVIDDSADDPDYTPPSLICGFTDPADETFAELVHDKSLGFIGIVDLRAAPCRAH